VTSVFPFVDPGSRTAVVEAVVENGSRRLLPGQYVQMQFVTGEKRDALSVPREALVRMGGAASVWVASADKAERREVATGLESGERVEIVAGLDEGERVVRRGHEGLYAGARVAEAGTGGSPAAKSAVGHGAHGSTPAPAAAPSPAAPQKKGGGHSGH
jgi:hypothetical protein